MVTIDQFKLADKKLYRELFSAEVREKSVVAGFRVIYIFFVKMQFNIVISRYIDFFFYFHKKINNIFLKLLHSFLIGCQKS